MILHTDQGSVYASKAYNDLLPMYGIQIQYPGPGQVELYDAEHRLFHLREGGAGDIGGMTIYTDTALKEYLEQAGFCKIQSHKNKKGWLCVTAQKR